MRFLCFIVSRNRAPRRFPLLRLARFVAWRPSGLKCRLVIEARPKGYFKVQARPARLTLKQ
jgi:hypothetical protein